MISEIMEIINKFIPDRNTKNQIEIELQKLEIEEFKQKKGIITRAFHLVFPFAVFCLVVMYSVEFFYRVQHYLKFNEWVTISIIPSGLELLALLFLGLLMPKKILEPIVKLVLKYLENKLDFDNKKRR